MSGTKSSAASAHPGRTPAQRSALDAIGGGDHVPSMARSTRDALIRAGMIRQCGEIVFGRGPWAVRVPGYEMTITTHLQWLIARRERAMSDDMIERVARVPAARCGIVLR